MTIFARAVFSTHENQEHYSHMDIKPTRKNMCWLVVALSIGLFAQCGVGDVQYNGKKCPCVSGWECVNGRCVPGVEQNSNFTRLTGVNWFGFETKYYVPSGLHVRDYKSMLQQIKDLGFNAIRIPWCNEMLKASPSGIHINSNETDPYTKQTGLNTDLEGLSSLEILDKIVDECQNLDLKVILDNHSNLASNHDLEPLWYTKDHLESEWIRDWKFLIDRYKNKSAVIAADLRNAPHGNTENETELSATWGYNEGYLNTDWRKAAITASKAVLEINPELIVIVSGIQKYKDIYYWWGGNLAGVKDYPILPDEIPTKNLWYSVHEQGPEVYNQSWFTAPDFPENLPNVWSQRFWFIYEQNIGTLFVGDFGIEENGASNRDSAAYKWFTKFMEQVGKKVSWTYWCINSSSRGLLKDDWVTINAAKYNLIKPYLAGADISDSNQNGVSRLVRPKK
jgi:aryl-phospho-beta-D-glucosidase BglC (GH1 family)